MVRDTPVVDGSTSRRWIALELAICAVLVTFVSLNALRRMDYFRGETEHHIRMTDASRSAYVGRNIAEGHGYKTNDLPSSLIDFYHRRGKLFDEEWVNADRFPFTAYATAALYTVTGSRSYTVGILVYNVLCFAAFLVLMYRLAWSLWGERWSALLAVFIALVHPYTYIYLYLKDADMLLLTVGVLTLLHGYFRAPPMTMSWRVAVGLGTLLAWMFLARPNLGAPFVLFFMILAGIRFVRRGRQAGWSQTLRDHARREILALVVAGLWLVPFVIHSMSEWGSPLFSANNMYQLPLGTRYGMGTDTWWKYTEPGHDITLGTILDGDRARLISKFTTSWVATIRSTVGAYGIELLLAFGALAWLGRRHDDPARRPFRLLAAVVGFAVALNLLLLPLYGYQHYAYRHYIGFIFPLMWIGAGHMVVVLAREVRPYAKRVLDHARSHLGIWIAVIALGLLLWNLGTKTASDQNRMLAATGRFVTTHWVAAVLAIVVIALHRYVFRPPWYPRVAFGALLLVQMCYRPDAGIKRNNLIWFPANQAVWKDMRTRRGVVSSFALQGEVAWNTGRKNIPVPEWPMHVYSFAYDHQLEVEDLYIESAAALLSTRDGPFSWMAPGFEGYQRLQEYRGHVPGYELSFHDEEIVGYAKYRAKPRLKASTVYKLVDRAAVAAMAHSPSAIRLGDPSHVIYTAHGFGRYLEIDGKQVVTAGDSTRRRYGPDIDRPHEDSGVTFFLDDRVPTMVELDIYTPRASTYTFYWNLDLYAYDHARDRAAHRVSVFDAKEAGWHKIQIQVPPGVTRKGLNKLGWRARELHPVLFCPPAMETTVCERDAPLDPAEYDGKSPLVMRPASAEPWRDSVSLFAHALTFHY